MNRATGDRLYYRGNTYHIYSEDDDWWVWQGDSYDDFAYEVEAQWVEGERDGGFGIIFRLQWERSYMLITTISSGGFSDVSAVMLEEKIFLIAWRDCFQIKGK